MGLATTLLGYVQSHQKRRARERSTRDMRSGAPSEQPTWPVLAIAPHRPTTAEDALPADQRVRVLIAGDDDFAQDVIPRGLREVGNALVVVATAHNTREALELARYYRPAVLILDTALPPSGCLPVIHELVASVPETQILTIAADDDATALVALRAGTAGHLSKDLDPHVLARMALRAARGEAIVPRRLVMRVLGLLREVPEAGWRPLRSRLTTREWEIVELLADGASTDEIAEHLVLSVATVYSHIKSLRRKLGATSRRDAVIAAQRLRREETLVTQAGGGPPMGPR